MEEKEQKVLCDSSVVENPKDVKTRKTLTSRQYRAFLAYCYDVQIKSLNNLEDDLDKLHNVLRKNSNSRQAGKEIRLAIQKQQNAIRQTKQKIQEISICFKGLNDFESLNKVSYQLSDEYILEESKRYEPKPSNEEGKDE